MITIAETKPDGSGECVTAQSARKGHIYYCVHCHCEMYRQHKGEHFFFSRIPGQTHLDETCHKLAKSLTAIDLDLTDPSDFHEYISTPPAPGSDGPGPVPGPHKPRKEEEKFMAFRSLKDFVDSGLLNVTRDISFKNGMLSDILINSYFASMIMRDNNSVGPRVLQVKPDIYFWRDQYIRFFMVSVVNDADGLHQLHRRKFFDFHFSDRETFIRFTRKIFSTKFVDGSKTPIIKPKYESILLHGVWSASSTSECKEICRKDCNGKWKCSGHQHADFTSSRQIYCPPDKKINKK